MEKILLGSIADIQTGPFGSQLHKEDYVQDGTPIVTVEHLGNRVFTEQNLPMVSDADKERLNKYVLSEGDIVFSRVGSVDRCSYVDSNHSGWMFSGRCLRVRPYNAIYPLYLYYFFCMESTKQFVRNIAVGATMPSINTKLMGEIEVSVPSIDTQKRIAAILSTIDDKIELNTAINENLEQQIQTILLNLIKSDSQKDSIENVKLGDYLYIKGRIGWKGLKKDEYLESSDYRIINGESLTKDGIDWRKAGYISAERYDESPEIMLQTGDILLSKDGTIGKIGYVDRLDYPSTVASGIFVIRNIKPDIISTPFIYYLLKSKLFTAFIASRTEGSVIPHLYQKDFMEFMIPLPNAQEMNQFDSLTSPLFATIVKNLRENELLAATRDALLPKLMNGEIDVSAVQI